MTISESKKGFSTIEILNLTTLSISVISFLLIGTVSLVLSTYLWPQVINCVEELGSEYLWIPGINICIKSGFVQLALFLIAAGLVGKELLISRKWISLIFNGLAVAVILSYSVFYILVSMSVLKAPVVHLASMN